MNLYIGWLLYKCYCFELSLYVVMATIGSFVLACLSNMYSENLSDVYKSREKSIMNKDSHEIATKQQAACGYILSVCDYLFALCLILFSDIF